MARFGEKRIGAGLLDDPAGIHYGDPVAGFGDHAQVVRNQHKRHPGFSAQRLQQFQDLRLDRDIQRGGRFVGDQQVRLTGQGHRDHHPLVLPAG